MVISLIRAGAGVLCEPYHAYALNYFSIVNACCGDGSMDPVTVLEDVGRIG